MTPSDPKTGEHQASDDLARYFHSLGLASTAWHLGPEHPALEELAIRLLETTPGARILEIGVQSGGFAVPVVLAAHHRAAFSYIGVDSLDYPNAVRLELIERFMRDAGVTETLRFRESDSTAFLRHAEPESWDLILLDHYKPKYPIDFYYICSRGLLAKGGVLIVHDVLANAAEYWKICQRIGAAFGYSWTIQPEVPAGAAIVRRGDTTTQGPAYSIAFEMKLRWYGHAAKTATRRRVGRMLRSAGLRG